MRDGSPEDRYTLPHCLRAAFLRGDIELGETPDRPWRRSSYPVERPGRHPSWRPAEPASSNGYHKQRTPVERLGVVKLLIDLGQEDVNAANGYGITPLMVATNQATLRSMQC